jgi:hypothetical protein
MLKFVLLSLYVFGMLKVDSFRNLYDESWCFYEISWETREQSIKFWACSLNEQVLAAARIHVLIQRTQNLNARLASSSEG